MGLKVSSWLTTVAIGGFALAISADALAAPAGQGQNAAGAGLFLAWIPTVVF